MVAAILGLVAAWQARKVWWLGLTVAAVVFIADVGLTLVVLTVFPDAVAPSARLMPLLSALTALSVLIIAVGSILSLLLRRSNTPGQVAVKVFLGTCILGLAALLTAFLI
ncbi:hypothetical protein [Algirhabdus cladophorae]|uniref:hypothetical protein n=1 Tax=Algirhabdus cladophorae TaxID=3377108 RepID=UPI003B84B1D0